MTQEDFDRSWKSIYARKPTSRSDGILCTCDKCGQTFRLWQQDSETKELHYGFVDISACGSGGIYGAVIACPHCKHEHEIF